MTNGAKEDPPPQSKPAWHQMFEPVTIVAVSILISVFVFVLISAASPTGGLLARMAQPTFARGLITYFFAVVTIGTAVVLLIAGLTHAFSEDGKARFDRGKDILSLLLGVFGTIVGFYFGSEAANQATTKEFAVTPMWTSNHTLRPGETTSITAYVSGGTPPYQFEQSSSGGETNSGPVDPSGWIVFDFTAPQVSERTGVTLTLDVTDADGKPLTTSTRLFVVPN